MSDRFEQLAEQYLRGIESPLGHANSVRHFAQWLDQRVGLEKGCTCHDPERRDPFCPRHSSVETSGGPNAGLSQSSISAVDSRLDGDSHSGGVVADGAATCACGSSSLRVRRCLSGEQFVQVECQRCYQRGPIGARAPDAVAAWNRRSQVKTEVTPEEFWNREVGP